VDDLRNWRQSQLSGGTPGSVEYPAIVPYVGNPEIGAGAMAVMFDYGTTWKFFAPGTVDPGTTWRNASFNDAAWGSGPGLLGFEEMGLRALAAFPELAEISFTGENRLWDTAQVWGPDERVRVYTDPRPPYGQIELTLGR
jgi:hypothetical protein